MSPCSRQVLSNLHLPRLTFPEGYGLGPVGSSTSKSPHPALSRASHLMFTPENDPHTAGAVS